MFYEILSLSGSILGSVGLFHLIPYATQIIDMGHVIFPRINNNQAPEYLLIIQIILALFQETTYVEKLLWNLSLFYWSKMLTSWITILPSLNTDNKTIKYYGFAGGHNDYLPLSGHTGLSLMLALYTGYHTLFIYLIQCYCLIAMRRHYTIELVISSGYVWLLWNN